MSRHLIISSGIGFGLGCAIWSVFNGNPIGGAVAVIGLAVAFLANIGAIGKRP